MISRIKLLKTNKVSQNYNLADKARRKDWKSKKGMPVFSYFYKYSKLKYAEPQISPENRKFLINIRKVKGERRRMKVVAEF